MGTAQRRLAVRFDEAVWREAVRGFSRGPLEVATSARRLRQAVSARRRRPAVKATLRLRPAARPGADSTLVWVFVAFGHRHPRGGVRSVYERAHRQLHGRFPEQSRCGFTDNRP